MPRRKKMEGEELTEDQLAIVTRTKLSPEARASAVQTRIQLGHLLASDGIPAVLRTEAEKLMSLGLTQLWRRIEKARQA